MSQIWSDLRFASRTLRAEPAFAGIAILSLALGIGANTAIFSVVQSVLLRNLPYRNAQQLLHVGDHQPCCEDVPMSPGEYLDYKAQNKSLQGLAAWTWQSLTLTGNAEPQRLQGRAVTPNFFDVLGAKPELGRLMSSRIDQPSSATRVAVLSDSLWRGRFAGDPNIVGRDIRLNGNLFRVIGVLAGKQEYPADAEIWINARVAVPEFQETESIPAGIAQNYQMHWLEGVARLKPGVSPAAAGEDLQIIARRIDAAHPDQKGHWAVTLPLQRAIVHDIRPALLVLLTAVALLLLIACANITGLMLARSTARVRELAIRISLGATRWEVTRLLLSESLLLAGAGGACGIFIALGALRLINLYSPYELPAALAPNLNFAVLCLALGITLFSALITGVIPALNATNIDINQGLKESAKGTSSKGTQRLRRILVMSEVALSVMLLIGACLLLRSFSRLLTLNPGSNSARVLTAQISLPRTRYSKLEDINNFWNRLLPRVQSLPGVESVGFSSDIPTTGASEAGNFEVEGQPNTSRNAPYADHLYVSPSLFSALGIPIIRGRNFTEDDRLHSNPVVLINKTMADRLFANQNPIGKHLRGGTDSPWETIVGVVGNVQWEGLGSQPSLDIYRSYAQVGYVSSGALILRLRPGMAIQAADLRRTVQALDSDLPIYKVKSLSSYIDQSLGHRGFLLGLIGAFSGLAILLAGIGLNAILAYSVEQRRQEIGIRVAVGASKGDVLWLVLRECLVIASAGVAAGLLGATWSSSLLRSMLFGVSSGDAVAYAVAVILIVAVAVAASLVPALRAARVDPVSALRYQ